MDIFGLEREKKINESGVREIFTPHQPILNIDLFFGRQNEVQNLIEHLNTPGQHAILFGERGVGKSSLANIACDILLKNIVRGKFFKKRCDSQDTFVTIVSKPLKELGVDINILSEDHKKSEGGNAGIGISIAKAAINTTTTKSRSINGYRNLADSPSWVAEQLKGFNGLFLIDEIDAINNEDEKKKLAELIKQLSDEGSRLKIFLVGIAESASSLTAGHPSVQRCLRETRLGRMSKSELRLIIEYGQNRLGIKFSEQAISRIVNVSSGYPHFTHLLALKAAEEAIANDQKTINVMDIERATRKAMQDAEGSLKESYMKATRSATTDTFKKILLAASICKSEEFTAAELRDAYYKLWGERINQGSLNNYFRRLVSDDGDTLMRRLAKGVYRFCDPRMPSYIKIAQGYLEENAAEQGASPDRYSAGAP